MPVECTGNAGGLDQWYKPMFCGIILIGRASAPATLGNGGENVDRFSTGMVQLLALPFRVFPYYILAAYPLIGEKMKLKLTPDDQTAEQLTKMVADLRLMMLGFLAIIAGLTVALIGALHNAH